MSRRVLHGGRRRALHRWLAASLVWSAAALALAEGPRLQGELRIVSGVQAVTGPVGAHATVPLALQVRLDLAWRLDRRLDRRLELRAVATPTVAVGLPGGPGDRPRFAPGVEEFYLRLRPESGDLDADLDLGVVRWPVGELRLSRPLRLDGLDPFGTTRGLLGARAAAFAHPWRVRLGAASRLDDELRPESWGGLLAARVEAGGLTAEVHGFAFDRLGIGLTGSGTFGQQVAYGEVWVLNEPWEGRGGVGLSSYLATWLWTGEAAWGPPDGATDGASARSARPSLRLSASRTVGRDASVDALAGVAWPKASSDPDRRIAAYDLSVTLTLDRPEAVLTLQPWWLQNEGTTALGVRTTVSTYF